MRAIMKKLGKIIGGLFLLIALAGFGAFMWFWGRPVGINNYINKVSLQLMVDSPELLTSHRHGR